MISPYVLIKIPPLLGAVSAVWTLELGLLATLVSRVPHEGGSVLVAFSAPLTPIWILGLLLSHPYRGEILDQRQHRIGPLEGLRHHHARQHICDLESDKKNEVLVNDNKRTHENLHAHTHTHARIQNVIIKEYKMIILIIMSFIRDAMTKESGIQFEIGLSI